MTTRSSAGLRRVAYLLLGYQSFEKTGLSPRVRLSEKHFSLTLPLSEPPFFSRSFYAYQKTSGTAYLRSISSATSLNFRSSSHRVFATTNVRFGSRRQRERSAGTRAKRIGKVVANPLEHWGSYYFCAIKCKAS